MAHKITLITGCSSGIGMSIATRLARDTAKRYLVYPTMRNLEKKGDLEKAAGKYLNKTLFIRELDIVKEESVVKAVNDIISTHGRIDVLVNNAGVAGFNALEYMSWEEVRDIMETNFFGTARMIKEVLPHMKQQRSGHIVSVTSLSGLLGYPFYEIYCASKHAVEGLTDSLASRLLEFNIKISSVNPGPVMSMINENLVDSKRLPGDSGDKNKIDEVTRRQLRLIGRYQKWHFDEKRVQRVHEVAAVVQTVLETETPALRNTTSDYGIQNLPYRYSDLDGNKWVNHKRRLMKEPGV